jgi:hypothetical protein
VISTSASTSNPASSKNFSIFDVLVGSGLHIGDTLRVGAALIEPCPRKGVKPITGACAVAVANGGGENVCFWNEAGRSALIQVTLLDNIGNSLRV